MNIVFLSEQKGQISSFNIDKRRVLFCGSGLLMLASLFIYIGYLLAPQPTLQAQQDSSTEQMRVALDSQRTELDSALQDAELNMNAMSRQLGKMQAHVIRLDALGQQLTKMAKLEKGEFDFSQSPAVGGPHGSSTTSSTSIPDFMQQFDELSRQLDDRSSQLSVLETMLMNRKLHDEVSPAGRPIRKGWVSSYYGMRNDPFTGKREHHQGIDLAGKQGSEVISVASGVVTWASKRYGYGNLVEVNHGNGYTTRYGHNKSIIVKVGDKISKGDVLSLMGSTGRSTGPHVHFEVLKNGRHVDPTKYISKR